MASKTVEKICNIMMATGFWEKKTRTAFLKQTTDSVLSTSKTTKTTKSTIQIDFPCSWVKDIMQFVDESLIQEMIKEPWFKFDFKCLEVLEQFHPELIIHLLYNMNKFVKGKTSKKILDNWWEEIDGSQKKQIVKLLKNSLFEKELKTIQSIQNIVTDYLPRNFIKTLI